MRTAEEILKKHMAIDTDSGYKIGLKDTIINAMKEYAKEAAQEALKNASENAKLIDKSMNIRCKTGHGFEVDKQSILNESNIPTI